MHPRLSAIGRVALLVTAPLSTLGGQSVHPEPPPEVRAVRLEGSVALDGRLDEAAIC